MTTAILAPSRAAAPDVRQPSTAATALAPLGVVLLAAALWRLTRSGALGPIPGAGVSEIVDLSAQIGLWLGTAWLIKRVFSLAISHYSERNLRRGGGLRGVASGRKLLIDLFGLVVFLGALFGIVGVVLGQPIGGLLASSALLPRSSALPSME